MASDLTLTRRTFGLSLAAAATSTAGVSKIKDFEIYKDDLYYSSFPSIVRRKTGELLVAFRRAPDRRVLGFPGVTHTDPNSYCVLVRSTDNGATWQKTPDLLYAHPLGGSQDPCMVQLAGGSIVCTSYVWIWRGSQADKPRFTFNGGYVLRSDDGGRTWKGPFYPPPIPGRDAKDTWGHPLPPCNRGAICQGRDGRLYWAVASGMSDPARTDVHLLISTDRGETWTYSCPLAQHPTGSFNETSLYETPKGDLVAFLRSEKFDDQTCVARSTDHGKSFQPWQSAGWQGHPHHAVRLEDNRVLLVYGYRHAPYGVRARILDPECQNIASAPEIVLRDDGGNGDLGYPWAVTLPNRQALVTYYINHKPEAPRYIAGTLLSY